MAMLKEKFGKRVKELRKIKGLTQEDFAERINIAPRNLSKIETGQTFPTVDNIEKIASVLNCSVSELFTFEHFGDINNFKMDLIKKISTLEDNDIKILQKFINIY